MQWQGLLNWKCSMTKTDSTHPLKILRERTPSVTHRPYDRFFFHSPTSLDSFMSSMENTEELFPESPLKQWGTNISLHYSF